MHESTIIRIKERMLHLKHSQTQLANLLGWDQAKISRILTKDYDPKMGELEKLAEVLKVDSKWLLYGEE